MLAQVSRTLVCALHRICELTLLVGLAMVMHVYMSWLDAGAAWPSLSVVELLPGELLVRTCKRTLFVRCLLLCVLACSAVHCDLLLPKPHHCVHHHHYHHHH